LRHSYGGYLRSMEMSSTKLFVFVEGIQSDPFFYGSICTTVLNSEISFDVVTANQIPGNAGGKSALMKFFEFLRQKKALVTVLGGINTTSLFFVDKDIDDILRKKKKSPHLVYTKYYDVQNYLFLHGDIEKALCAAASINPNHLIGQNFDAVTWTKSASALWSEWVALCIYVAISDLRCSANYGIPSKIQSRPFGSTDLSLYNKETRELARKIGTPVSTLRANIDLEVKSFEKRLSKSDHHKLFKGKWFSPILADNLASILGSIPYNKNGLSARLPSAIAATLDFNQPWADHIKVPIRDISKLLKVVT
jgi:hypothetical protein